MLVSGDHRARAVTISQAELPKAGGLLFERNLFCTCLTQETGTGNLELLEHVPCAEELAEGHVSRLPGAST